MNKRNPPWNNGMFNKGTKRPKGDARKFVEKECSDCGLKFVPTSGIQLYCRRCKAERYADNLLTSMGDDAYT